MTEKMTKKLFGVLVALFAVCILGTPFSARAGSISNVDPDENSKLNEKRAVALSQGAIGQTVGDYSFRDTEGNRVRLSDFRGKPLVVSLVYSSCSDVCPVITQTLRDVDMEGRDTLGEDAYTIVTIGFDIAADNPGRMKSFARQYGVKVSDHWRFLSGDFKTIQGLVEDLGFQFFESPKGFDHLTQTTILDKNGVVYRQIYGESFDMQHFVGPLKELVWGTKTPFASLSDLLNRVRLFCTIYDPRSDQYRFEYAIFFRFFVGATIILGMMWFVGSWFWKDYRRNKALKADKMGQSPPPPS